MNRFYRMRSGFGTVANVAAPGFPVGVGDTTFVGWFRINVLPGADQLLFAPGQGGTFVQVKSDDHLVWRPGISLATVPINEWFHVAIRPSYTDSEESMFLNGVKDGIPGVSGPLDGDFNIQPSPSYMASIDVAEGFGYIDRALTDDEIAAIVAAGVYHDLTTSSGDWTGEVLPLQWYGEPVSDSGAPTYSGNPVITGVPNRGDGVAAILGFYIDAVETGPIATPTLSPRDGTTGPHPALGNVYVSPGTPGAYFQGLGGRLPRLSFSDDGGVGLLTLLWWLRRPRVPSVTDGTIVQITRGDAAITISVVSGEFIRVVVTDGTTTVEDTTSEPMRGMTWEAVGITIDPDTEELTLYFNGESAFVIDVSTLTIPAAETELTYTIGANTDGTNPVDVEIIGWTAFDQLLTGQEINALGNENGPGPTFDPSNPVGPWTGETDPVILFVDPVDPSTTPPAVPNAGTDDDEVLVLVGGVTVGLLEPDEDDSSLFDFGFDFGHPTEMVTEDAPTADEIEAFTFGFGDEHHSSAPDYDPPMYGGLAMATTNTSGEFGDDGGALVELYAPAADLPSRGPYRIRLIDADGNLWPPASLPGCPAAIAGAFDNVNANASREYLRFALPVLPQGAYGVVLTWDDGSSTATFDDMILVVPADTSMEALWLGDSMR